MPNTEDVGTENLLSMINQVDVEKVGDVLNELSKYEKLLDKVSGIIMRLNRIGVLPAVMRIVGVKTGLGDELNKPLPQVSPLSIEAKSPAHLLLFKELNKQSEDSVTEILKQSVIAEAEAKAKAKSKQNDKN